MQTGHRTALAIVEEFGLLDAAYPGRFDLGLGGPGRGHRRQLIITTITHDHADRVRSYRLLAEERASR